jgi:3-oxoacyl-[acyl-carrier protein] reductase
MNKIDLNHRHAVITGGAQGIGLAVATRILASGASVSLWDGDVKLLTTVAKRFEGKGSISVEDVDVADPDSVSHATEATLAKHGAIDILVANAGIAG